MAARRYSAHREVTEKSEHAIEIDTAKKWRDRSIACYARYRDSGVLTWLLRAEQYRHEAIEHASGAGDYGRLVGKIEHEIDKHRPREARSV